MAKEVVNKDWQSNFIPHFMRGLNQMVPPEALDASFLSKAENVVLRSGNVEAETGASIYAGNFLGDAQKFIRVEKRDKTIEIMLITTEYFYTRDVIRGTWNFVNDGTSSTLNSISLSGATSMVLNNVSGLSIGDWLGVVLDNGDVDGVKINTIVGNGITFGENLTSQASIGSVVFKARDFTGTDADTADYVWWPAFDQLYITNWTDPVMIYDGSTCQELSGLPSAYFRAKTVELYKDRLWFGHLSEGPDVQNKLNYQSRIRWCEAGDDNRWDPATYPDAGFIDFLDNDEDIVVVKQLGLYLIIYRKWGIIRGEYLGAADVLMRWQEVISDEGAISVGGVYKDSNKHWVIGQNSFYKYSGAFDIDNKFSNPVLSTIYNSVYSVPASRVGRFGVIKNFEHREYWFIIPIGVLSRIFKYNAQYDAWTIAELPNITSIIGTLPTVATFTWADLRNSWEDYKGISWNDPSLDNKRESQHLILTNKDGGLVRYNFSRGLFIDKKVKWEIQTKDFISGEYHLRFDVLECLLNAPSGIAISYSLDGGASWKRINKTVARGDWAAFNGSWQNLSGDWEGNFLVQGDFKKKTILRKQFVGNRIRFKFSGDDPQFQLGWMSIRFKNESLF